MKNKYLLFPAAVSVLAILPWPYEFYTLVRIVVCTFAAYLAYGEYKKSHLLWSLFAAIALLFNPIVPIHLYVKDWWAIINFFTAVLFFWFYMKGKV
jgi:hypothetical protein